MGYEEKVLTVRAPAWLRGLYTGTELLLTLMVLIAFLIIRSDTGVSIGLLAAVLAVVMVPVVVASWSRRLEVRGDRITLVRATGRAESEIEQIASMRVYRIGNGLARCVFVKRDGSFALGRARGTWRAADLIRMATAIRVPVEEPTAVT